MILGKLAFVLSLCNLIIVNCRLAHYESESPDSSTGSPLTETINYETPEASFEPSGEGSGGYLNIDGLVEEDTTRTSAFDTSTLFFFIDSMTFSSEESTTNAEFQQELSTTTEILMASDESSEFLNVYDDDEDYQLSSGETPYADTTPADSKEIV